MYTTIKIISGCLILIFFSWMEVTLLYRITIIGVKPLLLWLGVLFIALWEKEIAGLTFGFLAGCLADFSSGGHFGLNTVCFAFGGYLMGRFWMKFAKESLFTQVVVAFLSSMFYLFLYYFLSSFFHPLPSLKEAFKRIILPVSIYTTIIAPLIFGLLDKGYRIFQRIKFPHKGSNIHRVGKGLNETEYLECLD